MTMIALPTLNLVPSRAILCALEKDRCVVVGGGGKWKGSVGLVISEGGYWPLFRMLGL